MNITGKGMKFRWLNNAGFEMELSSGKTSFSRSMVRQRHRSILSALMRLNGRIMFFSPIHMMTIQTVSDGSRSASHRQPFLWGICLRKHCVRNMT